MIGTLLLAAVAAMPAAETAQPLTISAGLSVEQRVVAADGSVRFVARPAGRATPGDRVTVTLAYRNTGKAPIAGVVLSNPVPAGLVLADAGAAEVSVDGRRFAPLAALRITATGGERAATAADVVAVRWRLASAVPPGGNGAFSFRAVVK